MLNNQTSIFAEIFPSSAFTKHQENVDCWRIFIEVENVKAIIKKCSQVFIVTEHIFVF